MTTPRFLQSPVVRPALAVGATLAMCTAVLAWLYRPLTDWLTLPLTYTGDGLWSLFVIKTVLQTGWYASNPQLGAPFEANFLDFAKPEVLHLAFYRFAGLFTQNIALIHNLFFGLGFHFVALSALAVLRRGFGLSWPLAMAGALLFTFLPFHFIRLEHLFLASYYAVPIAAWLVLRVSSERPPFHESGRLGTGRWTVWVACAVLASTSIYYAFFGLCLIFAAGLLESLRSRAWKHLLSGGLVCALVGSLVLINLAPSLWHRHTEGRNTEVAARPMHEVEVYALRPLQLVLPSNQHRSPTLAGWTRAYEAGATFVNENRTSTLGLLGSVGFLLMLLALLSGHRSLHTPPTFGVAARASAVAVLLAVAGGGGTLIALVFEPQFRALNRISVVIAFFSIAALLLLVQRGAQKVPAVWRQGTLVIVATLLFSFGLWDQAPAHPRPSSDRIGPQYASDRAFVQRIEQALPPGSGVLQLPYVAFPEAPPLHKAEPYSSLRGFLHSQHLRWSHGGVRGREGDLWHRTLAKQPTPELLRLAAASGFSGLWLDRRATPDHGEQLERGWRAHGLHLTLTSDDGSLAFYALKATGTPSTPPPRLPPLLGKGFHGWEHGDEAHWAWTSGDAQLTLSPTAALPQRMRVVLGLRTLVPRGVRVIIGGTTVASAQLVPGDTQELAFEHVLTTPNTTVQLLTDAPAQAAGGGDPRVLALALMSFEMTELERAGPP
ncbi:hypothetical protein ACVC7V_20035 [Hydrogenophaga sp. A37]|uniref:hypothetical protein n=1 Tax=Hydrogenophaga sp. A37 TaxID=1945864 RepID=UPI0009842657|nr:hypothetical protein [Hydrogenophaga sp. A37]OOG84924.1 hypothetical protein B0E41_09885 [Hydrogenophaga sp. A37]